MCELPKIVKDAQRVRAMIEEAFIRMARKHRYGCGLDLRAAAASVVRLCLQAWRERIDRVRIAQSLCGAVDALKLELQLAKDVNAFRNWDEFEAIVRLVDEVGRQSGGWPKRLTPKGQNAQAAKPPAQRAPILSSRPAFPARATP
jgi:hypothetical protein